MKQTEKARSTAKTVGIVMLIMLVGKATGLFREMALNSFMNPESAERIAFNPANVIPSQFLDFAFAAAMSSSFIPVFNSFLKNKGKEQAYSLANVFITIMFVLSSVFVVIGIVFARQLISIFEITDPETVESAIFLLRVMLPTITLTAIAFSLTGVLQSLGEFSIPAAMSVLSNVIIILYFFFLYDSFGVIGLAVAFVVGWTTQILVQLPSLFKKGYIFKPSFDLKNSGLKEIGLLMLPVMVSTWIQPVNTLVNASISSRLFDGAGTGLLSTAGALYSVITGVFILSIANVVFPKLSKQNAGDDRDGFSKTIRETLRASAFLLLPMCVGLILLSEPIVRLMYERGGFTAFSTEQTSIALVYYAIGILGLGFQTILSRAFYASKDAKTPFLTGVLAIAVNFVCSFLLINQLGVGGPALASSISINLVGIIMLFVIRKRDKQAFDKEAFTAINKMTASAFVMGVFVYFVREFLPDGKNAGFVMRLVIVAIPVVCGVIAYFVVALALKIDEANAVFSQIKKITKRGIDK